MRLTRVIAIGVIACSLGLTVQTALQAQSLRTAGPPAEFPPASYTGKQYVDSRGCVYIRAGVDGYVTWVPRVTRSRKVVCGYKPSLPPGTQAAPSGTKRTAGVEQITLPAGAQPPAAAPAKPKPSRTATPARPTAPTATPPKPTRTATLVPAPLVDVLQGTQRPPSPGPEPTVWGGKPVETETTASTAPVTVRTAPPTFPAPQWSSQPPSPGPKPTVWGAAPAAPATGTSPTVVRTAPTSGKPASRPAPVPPGPPPVAVQETGCPNASAFSNQYVNKGGRFKVRCGPQSAPPVTYRIIGDGAGLNPGLSSPAPSASAPSASGAYPTGTSVASATQGTRVVRRHIYDRRQNTTNVSVPPGYASVWEDDRLNPHRAERTLAPTRKTATVTVPEGYRSAWKDDRLNPRRGGSAAGEGQSQQIWAATVPRRLNPVPTDRQVIRNPNPETPGLPRARTAARPDASGTKQLRKDPAPASAAARRYVRVAAFETDAQARQSAQALARKTGLPVRLGTATRQGKSYRVVMAGPFSGDRAANAAVSRVRAAGFPGARLTK